MNEVNNNVSKVEQNTVNVQEPVNMVNNVNNQPPKKSKKGIIVIILLLLIIAGLCTFIYMKKDVLFNSGNNTNENNNVSDDNTNNNQTNVKQTNNQVPPEVKADILKTIFLTENGVERMSTEEISKYSKEIKKELIGTDYYDDVFGMNPFFDNGFEDFDFKIDGGEKRISELNADSKKYLIWNYAIKYKMYGHYEPTNENHPCRSGTGECWTLSEDNYKKIAKKYGISENGQTIFPANEYENGMYLYFPAGSLGSISKITDKLDIYKNNNDIIVKYDIKLNWVIDNSVALNETIKYTFKQNTEGDYYLYSVNATSNK